MRGSASRLQMLTHLDWSVAVKLSKSPNHAYEPEPYPILNAWPQFGWMREEDKANLEEGLARMYGGEGYRPRRVERER
jgi:hypothetical protein